jgi:hypothetical protein
MGCSSTPTHLREQVACKTMVIKYCLTNEMLADLLTKGLTEAVELDSDTNAYTT